MSLSPYTPYSHPHPRPQVLGHPILEQHLPAVSLIGEFSDPEELGKLLQLVLGCAISCEKKQGMGVRGPPGDNPRKSSHPLPLCFSLPHLDPQSTSRES